MTRSKRNGGLARRTANGDDSGKIAKPKQPEMQVDRVDDIQIEADSAALDASVEEMAINSEQTGRGSANALSQLEIQAFKDQLEKNQPIVVESMAAISSAYFGRLGNTFSRLMVVSDDRFSGGSDDDDDGSNVAGSDDDGDDYGDDYGNGSNDAGDVDGSGYLTEAGDATSPE